MECLLSGFTEASSGRKTLKRSVTAGPVGKPNSLTIGRRKESTLVVPNIEVSREHAKVLASTLPPSKYVVDATTLPSRYQYEIMDKGTRNGTFLNGVRLLPNAKAFINTGDKITLGTETEFTVTIEDKAAVRATGVGS